MILKMHLAKIIVAIIAVPARKSIADHTLAYGFVVIVIFARFCRRWFLLF
jgi:hypothetical protein